MHYPEAICTNLMCSDLAKGWLLNSGIQNLGGREGIRGGFHAWYDLENTKYPYLYSEITGYGITALLYLNNRRSDRLLIARAELAARWLIYHAFHECGGVRTKYYYDRTQVIQEDSFQQETIYAFDTGMVLYGLINLYKIVQQERYLTFATRVANFLIDQLQQPSGLFYTTYHPKTKAFGNNFHKWSAQLGSFHNKIALGLLDLYKVIGDPKYKQSAEKICQKSLEFQQPSGRFVTSTDQETHLHAHCYSAEGLLYAGVHLAHEPFIHAAARATQWALDQQLEDGGIPSCFWPSRLIPYQRSDILAQVLRLGSLLLGMGKLSDSYSEHLVRLRARLTEFQNPKGPQRGGFYFGFGLDGTWLPHLNAWCTMVALQALDMYDQHLQPDRPVTLDCFV